MREEQEAEVRVANHLATLAATMDLTSIQMAEKLKHLEEAEQHAAELRGAAAKVRQWVDRLSGNWELG